MTPELITSLGTLLAGVLGGITALILALRKRVTEEEVPELRRRNGELEAELEAAGREIGAARADVVFLDGYVYILERFIAQHGLEQPARPAHVQAAVNRSRVGRRR